MSTLNNPEYYARREAQERSLASQSTDAGVAAIHSDMADRYAQLKRGTAVEVVRPRARLKVAYSAS